MSADWFENVGHPGEDTHLYIWAPIVIAALLLAVFGGTLAGEHQAHSTERTCLLAQSTYVQVMANCYP